MKGEYYKTKESVDEYIRLAQDVDGGSLIEKLKGLLKQNSKLLELGSGPGTDLRILQKTYQVIGSDFSDDFLKYLISKFPSGKFLKLDAITIETELKFDGIYSNKVLHHLKDEELKRSIKRQWNILNPNGVICHSFWEGKDSEIFKGMFVNYHTRNYLENCFTPYFEIITLEPYKEFEDNDSLLIIAKKQSAKK